MERTNQLFWPWPFLFFAASAASAADADAAVTAAAASAASAADADLQYLQVAGIRNRNSATADRCATNELHSPLRPTKPIRYNKK